MTTPVIYGTVSDVAALARVWTDNGSFVDPTVYVTGTNPTLSQVDTWLEQVSAQVDLALANHQFIVPIDGTLTEVVNAISSVVIPLVADLCHAANSSGRFFTERAIERGTAPFKVVTNEINSWVETNQDGLAAMGLTQRESSSIKKQVYMRVIGKH
jgi:hypothetical protein